MNEEEDDDDDDDDDDDEEEEELSHFFVVYISVCSPEFELKPVLQESAQSHPDYMTEVGKKSSSNFLYHVTL